MIPLQPMTPNINNQPSAKKDLAIAARWEELLPWCVMDAKRTSDPASTLHMFKARHHARCVELFCNRITWASIRRADIDNPRNDDSAFKTKLREAIERRRSRMNRKKGQRKDASC